MIKQPSEKDKKRFQRAMQALEGGSPKEAVNLFEKVRKSWGDNADIWYLEGLAYGKLNLVNEVKRVSMRALQLDTNHFGALCNLANAQIAMNDQDEALNNYRKALEAKPGDPTVSNNYGRTLAVLGHRDEAIIHFENALHSNSGYAPAHVSLAQVYAEGGFPEKAFSEYRQALNLDNRLVEAYVGIGNLYCSQGGLFHAKDNYKKALELQPDCIQAYIGLGTAERYLGNYDDALKLFNEAEEITEDERSIMAAKADLMERMGNVDAAHNLLMSIEDRYEVNPVAVATMSRICRKYNTCDKALGLIDKTIQLPSTDKMQQQMLHYSAANLLDKLGRYDEAFQHYVEANEALHVPFDRDRCSQETDELINNFNLEAMKQLPRAETNSSRPIFILGMPRSGTTLTEQILASHPGVYGAGELIHIKDLTYAISRNGDNESSFYANSIGQVGRIEITRLANQYLDELKKLDADARFVTDKMPQNFLHLGLINLLFPQALIIHCKRNALDNCLSVYFQSFLWTHDYATDLHNIGFYYREYERLMKHWQSVIDIPIMTIQYEDMIDDQEGMSRKLLEFCGLKWDESVLSFHDSKRSVATASYDQVRQPIYKSSRERWRNYEKHIGALRKELGSYGEN